LVSREKSHFQFPFFFRYWRLEGVDKVLVPVHLNDNHWAMVVATVPSRSIELFDSMNNGVRTDTKKRFMQTVL
jgi:Ulp1 family protease